jgi:hypothetical protein
MKKKIEVLISKESAGENLSGSFQEAQVEGSSLSHE